MKDRKNVQIILLEILIWFWFKFFLSMFLSEISDMKISYHCISCKKEFNDLESANIHVKSTKHEIIEETPGYWI